MKPRYYLLDKDKNPVPASLMEWANWFEGADKRRVKNTTVEKGVDISTVFLGLDHGFDPSPEAAPILFETMIFGGKYDQNLQWRYETWQQALINHEKIVDMYLKGEDLNEYEAIESVRKAKTKSPS